MKKLIGMSLIVLFAIVGKNSSAQVYTSGGNTTIVKHKSDGTQKVKVVPQPAVVYPAYRPVEMYQHAPYYGYRKVKYYDDYGRSHKMIYGDPYSHHYHGHYDHYHYH